MSGNIAKWGNSLAIRIPQHIAREINVTEGSIVDFSVKDGNLTIQPKKRKRYSLEELVSQITPENSHGEIDSGVAVGNEVW
ncbi:AbrB/MazE/SpoVT family DNA-binding domain-containing protein [Rivularia sp. UHCC 0363]|uniref:AbrB/MazE/SpoVT family DNA-binding domain-containing protein n=1 Tax=Rivularia sp. UHCC 0363 TaxID=3110244 RepID=UPI002B1FD90E|nr:AbrB/MazE/SpoVT family DNA-binding domain-containing protein [Rivularia sp. UHCC 0363]MEA5594476.1 AbrB/MazE/SpoVT family DNA-binding domain-containing protein [Rivularia sp. UHCC 0363]